MHCSGKCQREKETVKTKQTTSAKTIQYMLVLLSHCFLPIYLFALIHTGIVLSFHLSSCLFKSVYHLSTNDLCLTFVLCFLSAAVEAADAVHDTSPVASSKPSRPTQLATSPVKGEAKVGKAAISQSPNSTRPGSAKVNEQYTHLDHSELTSFSYHYL